MENAQDVKDDVNDISNVLQEFKESKIKKDIDNDDDIGAKNSQDLIVSA